MTMNGTYHIETMGCQMNERDSETIAGILQQMGYEPAEGAKTADVIVLNTCAVREKPVHKVFSRLGKLRQFTDSDPDKTLIVAGCVAQVAADDLQKRAPYVDVIIGPRNLGRLSSVLQRIQQQPAVLTESSEVIPEGLPCARTDDVNAYVNITYGCDNFCSYCIVPQARGRELSRSPDTVIEEMRKAVEAGHPQVTLLGQNVNSYHGQDESGRTVKFAELLEMASAVDGLRRLRFTTSHPKDLSTAMLDRMCDREPICEHLHLPIQAGDDEVLHRMGRGYTYQQFKKLIGAARQRMPDIAITTDVMVGFPGETERQFQRTLTAFTELRFDQAFMFMYNDRPGTRAAKLSDKVARDAKQERLQRLIDMQNRISREKNEKLVGEVFRVLVEGPDEKSQGWFRGRTRTNKLMIFDPEPTNAPQSQQTAPPETGAVVPVIAKEAFLWGFKGRRSIS